MKILKNNVLLIFFISLFLVSCGSKKKTASEQENKKIIVTKENQNILRKRRGDCRRIDNQTERGRRERDRYNHQLEVLSDSSNFSYFDKNSLDLLVIRIPVANEDFSIYNSYNVSKGKDKRILVVISDTNGTSVCGEEKTHMLETVLFDYKLNHFKNNKPLELKEDDKLTVFVLNEDDKSFEARREDHLKFFCEREISAEYDWSCGEILLYGVRQPKEGGGGVIVGFP